jgi:hypothetical protein
MSAVKVYKGKLRLRDWKSGDKNQLIDDLQFTHQTYQLAVNYYIIHLAALARHGSTGKSLLSRLSLAWETNNKPFNEVADMIGCRPESLESLLERAVSEERVPGSVQVSIFDQLMAVAKGNIQQVRRDYWPRFCDPNYRGSFQETKDAKKKVQDLVRSLIQHESFPQHTKDFCDVLKQWHFANEQKANSGAASEPLSIQEAKAKVEEAIEFLHQQGYAKQIDRASPQWRKDVEFDQTPLYPIAGGSINKEPLKIRWYFFLICKYLEVPAGVFADWLASYGEKQASRSKKQSEKVEVGFRDMLEKLGSIQVDASNVETARELNGGVVFPAFTSLSCWEPRSKKGNAPFELMAFEGALMALNQFAQKTAERDKVRYALEEELCIAKGTAAAKHKDTDGESEFADLEGICLDERFELLTALLKELSPEYTLRRGSIRHFGEVMKNWRDKDGDVRPNLIESIKKWEEMNHSKGNYLGDRQLLVKLTSPQYHPVWTQEADVCAFLNKVCKYNYLEMRLSKAKMPINFKLADSALSPRNPRFDKSKVKYDGDVPFLKLELVRNVAGRRSFVQRSFPINIPRAQRDGIAPSMLYVPAMLEGLGRDACEASSPKLDGTAITLVLNNKDIGLKKREDSDALAGRIIFHLAVDIKAGTELLSRLGSYKLGKNDAVGPSADMNIHLQWPGQIANVETIGWLDAVHRDSSMQFSSIDLGQRNGFAHSTFEISSQQLENKFAWGIGRYEERETYASLIGKGVVGFYESNSGKRIKDRLVFPGEYKDFVEGICKGLMAELIGKYDLISDAQPQVFTIADLKRSLISIVQKFRRELSFAYRMAWQLKDQDKKERAMEQALEQFKEIKGFPYFEGQPHLSAPFFEERALQMREKLACSLPTIAQWIVPLRKYQWKWHSAGGNHYQLTSIERSQASRVLIKGQGGVSLDRIDHIEGLIQLAQSLNRFMNWKPGEQPSLAERQLGADIAPELAYKLKSMKDQRVNHVASGIVALALGVQLKSSIKKDLTRKLAHGQYERIPGRKPASFIVVENLSRYLADQGRERRENRKLVQWCHRAVLTKVKQMLSPFDIRVLEVPAAYSSLFCAYTQKPGFRARQLTKIDQGKSWIASKLSVRQEFADLLQLQAARDGSVLVPWPGGSLFVPLVLGDENIRVENADINAAINIGLRGIASPVALHLVGRIRVETEAGSCYPLRLTKRERACWREGERQRLGQCQDDAFKPNFYVNKGLESVVASSTVKTSDGTSHEVSKLRELLSAANEKSWMICQKIQVSRGRKKQN